MIVALMIIGGVLGIIGGWLARMIYETFPRCFTCNKNLMGTVYVWGGRSYCRRCHDAKQMS